MEGQRTRKGKKDCTTASCRATLCDISIAFPAGGMTMMIDSWTARKMQHCTLQNQQFWHVTVSFSRQPSRRLFPWPSIHFVLSPRRSLPWQTVFCFHDWLDFVRSGSDQIRSAVVGWYQMKLNKHMWCFGEKMSWLKPVCPCTQCTDCRSFFPSAPWEVRQLFQFSRVPGAWIIWICEGQFNKSTAFLDKATAYWDQKPATANALQLGGHPASQLANLPTWYRVCGFGWGSLLGLLGRALERGTSTYSKFGGDFFICFFCSIHRFQNLPLSRECLEFLLNCRKSSQINILLCWSS